MPVQTRSQTRAQVAKDTTTAKDTTNSRPLTYIKEHPFVDFCRLNQEQLKSENPLAKFGEIANMLREKWNKQQASLNKQCIQSTVDLSATTTTDTETATASAAASASASASAINISNNISKLVRAERDLAWFSTTLEPIVDNIVKINAQISKMQKTKPINTRRQLEFNNLHNITHLFNFINKYFPCIYEHAKIRSLDVGKCALQTRINEIKQQLETHKYIPRTRIEIITVASLRDTMASCEKTLNELV